MSLKNNGLFAVMGAGGNPDLATRRPLTTQRHRTGGEFRGDGNIELQATRDRKLVALQAEGDKARGIFFVLRGDQRNFAEQATHKFTQLAVPFRRAFRQTRVGDNQRNFTGMQGGNHIRPQFSFHDDHQFRANGIQETVHGAGEIVRQVDVMHVFTEGRHHAL